MIKNKNMHMHYTEPRNLRTPKYDEHYCFIFKDGRYVGALYLNAAMLKLWRHNKFSVVMTDI
jgi:hypothetical protein